MRRCRTKAIAAGYGLRSSSCSRSNGRFGDLARPRTQERMSPWRLALPEVSTHAVLEQVRRRWRVRSIALNVAAAGAALAAALVLTSASFALMASAVFFVVMLVRGVSLSNAGAAALV